MAKKYTITARVFPAILALVPFALMYIYMLSPYVKQLLNGASELVHGICGVAINVALMYILLMVNRWISKGIFQRMIFRNGTKMPTIEYLLPSNDYYDKITKQRIYSKINSLLTVNIEEDLKKLKDDKIQRKYLINTVGVLRTKLRGNQMLLQHNIEYGFMRNLIGGCVLASIACVSLIIFALCNGELGLFWTSLVLLILYCAPIIFSRNILINFGSEYAKVFFYELQGL